MLQVRLDRSLQHEPGISIQVMPRKHRSFSLHLFLNNLPGHLGRIAKAELRQLAERSCLSRTRPA
jgi:hypothetical protein